MIASAMLFLLAVSALSGAGALLAEAGLRRLAAPSRFAWLAAMALGPVLLGVAELRRLLPEAPAVAPAWAPVLEMPALTLGTGPADGGLGAEGVALLVWLVSGLAFLALVVRTHRTLLRERSGWESTQVLGRHVFVSTDRGPAVAGMWEPWIVVPSWVLALPEAELRMVLLHEEEHMRARDTRLLGAALALVALSAWNPLTWWQLRRLRSAMEVDCDRRVLRVAPDRATYGASLLTVAARAAGPSLGLAAFTERSLNLKRRILAMTEKTSRWTAMGGGVLVVLGLVVGVQACGVETPVGLAPTTGVRAVDEPPAQAEPAPEPGEKVVIPGGGVTFTPFTKAPRLLNVAEIRTAAEESYPPLLKDAGVTGVAQVWMFIDKEGVVTDVRINRSSGHQPLDAAALKVAGRSRFEPALDGEKPVDVWVSFPIAFGDPSQPGVIQYGGEGAPPPAPPKQKDLAAEPTFTPFTVAPSILNRDEVVAAMAENYPPEMRAAGVAGTVRVYFFVDDQGRVVRAVVDRSSGVPELDDAALRVAEVFKFSPALNKATKVPVWVSFPITFMTR